MNSTKNESFQENAVQQRLILEAAKDYAIFTTDLQHRITSWNVGAQNLFGYTEADILGQMADLLYVPEDRPGAPQHELEKARTEGRAENERWHLRHDGSRIYGSGVVTPLRDDTGTIVGLVKVMRDLTRQKQAEQALNQSEERFRAFVTATSDVVYRMSADWQEMHQLVGKSFLPDTTNTNASWLEQYIPPQDQAGVRAAIGEAIQAKKTFELTHRVVQADGSLGWTFSRAIPLLNEQGEVMEWFGTASDITEYKRAEKARQQSETQYRTLFNSIDEGFCIVEVLFDEQRNAIDYRFLETNPAFIRQTGLENAIGRTMLELAPDHEPFWVNTYGHIAKTGEAIRFEHPAAALGCYYDVYAFRIGEPTEHSVAILFNDITGRKQAEQRHTFLLKLSDALRPLADPVDIQATAAELLGIHLGADRAYYVEVRESTNEYVIARDWCRPGTPSHTGRYPLGDWPMPWLINGKTWTVRDITTEPGLSVDQRASYMANDVGAAVVVPLIKQGRLVATFVTNQRVPRLWTPTEISLVEETAERTWAAAERARSEENLAQSQRFVQGIITSLPLVIYLFDLVKRKNLYLSPQSIGMFGYAPDEMQASGTNLLPTYFHPDDLSRIADYFGQITNSTGDEVFSVECRMHHKERGWVWVVCRDIVYARDADGRPTQLLGTAEDITERKEAETALRQSDERFRTLVQNLPDYAIFQIDTDAIITEWTEGAQRVKGYTAEEAIGQSLSLFYTPENLAAGEMINEIEEATRNGRAERGSVRIRKGGERFWVDEIMTAIHDEKGRLVGFTKISRDITQRKKADEALFDSRQRLQIVLDSIADHAIITFDLQHRIVSWNPGAWQMFGYTADEAIGQSGEIFFTLEDRAAGQMEHEMRLAREQGRAPDERYHLRKDGSHLYVSGAMAPLFDADKTLLGYVKVARDLTNRQQMEQALREADRRKDEFLALLAHELRNPLATLSNTLLILKLTGGTHEAMPLPTATTMMEREVAHLVRLVDDLLDVSRISRGKIVLTRKRTDLALVVRETVEAAQGGFRAANRTLTADLPTASLYLSGDATRLKQVVSNLLSNALKFTQTGGHVWVSLKAANQESGGPMALLRVRDDGIGIADHDRERIFQMFVQLDLSLGRTQDGLGLGLTLVSELVHLHGGHVEVRSDGVGSEFIIYLPVEAGDAG